MRLSHPKNVILSYINVNSIRNKLDDLGNIVLQNVDFLCIAETKLDDSFPESQFMLDGYKKPYRLDASASTGGLLTYVNCNIPSRQLKYLLTPPDIQCIAVELNLRKQKWLIFSIYRNPSQNLRYFLSHLTALLDYYSENYENIIIIGDFNNVTTSIEISSFMADHGLYSLVNNPTCFKSVNGRCIDLILTNKKHSFQKSQSFETGVSDHHHMIYTMLKSTFAHIPPKQVVYCSFKNFSGEAFSKDLQANLMTSQGGNFSSFNEILSNTLRKHAPFKKRIIRGNNKPHINKELRKAIMKRSRLKNIYNKTKSADDYINYKRQRNYVVNLNKQSKRKFFKKIDQNNTNSSKDFWTACKPFFSNKCVSNESLSLIENDIIVQNENEVADIFNNFFINITSSLGITKWKNDYICTELHEILDKYSDHPSVNNIKDLFNDGSTFKFSHIHPWETYQVIMSMNPKKSTSGEISTKILQSVARICSVPLTDCINTCILEGTFPTELKLASVIPIHKQDDTTLKKNYRPISILPTLSKVFEKLISLQINQFFENKFSSYLCGFRANYSTQTALIKLLQKWQSCLDNSGSVGTILMDLSKAFDCLPHELLIAKLAAYGFNQNSLKLLRNYLSKRFQRVKVGSAFSSWLEILLGVPQGSILGPLLFNIFINDFFSFMQRTEVCNFADDNTIYSCASTIDAVISDLEVDMENSLRWFKTNQLVANPTKFQLMFLGMDERKLALYIDNKQILPSYSVKLLGIRIDRKLKFDLHINNICNQATKKLRCLHRIRKFVTNQQAMHLCNAFVLSNFKYCPLIWMYCSKTCNEKINRVHKRTLRSVTGEYECSLNDILLSTSGCTIHTTNLHTLLTEIFKSLFGSNPDLIKSLFQYKNNPHSLRTSSLLSLPPTKKVRFGTNSLLFRSCQLWNSLPLKIKLSDSVEDFKKSLLSWTGLKCLCPLCKP